MRANISHLSVGNVEQVVVVVYDLGEVVCGRSDKLLLVKAVVVLGQHISKIQNKRERGVVCIEAFRDLDVVLLGHVLSMGHGPRDFKYQS